MSGSIDLAEARESAGQLKSDVRGADYRARATEALRCAEDSVLLQVRQRHETAAGVWLELAAFEERRSAIAHQIAADRVDAAAANPDIVAAGPRDPGAAKEDPHG